MICILDPHGLTTPKPENFFYQNIIAALAGTSNLITDIHVSLAIRHLAKITSCKYVITNGYQLSHLF